MDDFTDKADDGVLEAGYAAEGLHALSHGADCGDPRPEELERWADDGGPDAGEV